MPSLTAGPSRRRQRADDPDDDDDDETPLSQASNGSKRMRLESTQERDTEGDEEEEEDQVEAGEEEDEEDDDADEESNAQPTRVTKSTALSRSLGGARDGNKHRYGNGEFKPGAIVRIKLTDFVTYTSAEFFPGPKLNMVIGPNGTGKSTLVCAICLGLGWGPQVGWISVFGLQARASSCHCIWLCCSWLTSLLHLASWTRQGPR